MNGTTQNDSVSKKSKPAYHGSRTIALLEVDGWEVQDQTERIVRMGAKMVRQDLFGFGDRLALRTKPNAQAMLIQETGGGSGARLKKITGNATPADEKEGKHFEWVEKCAMMWIKSGSSGIMDWGYEGRQYLVSLHRIQVWSWRKFKPKRGGKQELWKCVRFEVLAVSGQDGGFWLDFLEIDQVLPNGRLASTKKV